MLAVVDETGSVRIITVPRSTTESTSIRPSSGVCDTLAA